MSARKHPILWLLALGCFVLTGCQTDTGHEESSSWFNFGSHSKAPATTSVQEPSQDTTTVTPQPTPDSKKDAKPCPPDDKTMNASRTNPAGPTAGSTTAESPVTAKLENKIEPEATTGMPSNPLIANVGDKTATPKPSALGLNATLNDSADTTPTHRPILSLPELAASSPTQLNQGSDREMNLAKQRELKGKVGAQLTLPDIAEAVMKNQGGTNSPSLELQEGASRLNTNNPVGLAVGDKNENIGTKAAPFATPQLEAQSGTKARTKSRLSLPGFKDDADPSRPDLITGKEPTDAASEGLSQRTTAKSPSLEISDKVVMPSPTTPWPGLALNEALESKTSEPTSITLSIASQANPSGKKVATNTPPIPDVPTTVSLQPSTTATPLPPAGSELLVLKTPQPPRPFRLSEWISDEAMHRQWVAKQNAKSTEELATRAEEQRRLREAMLKYLIKDSDETKDPPEKK